MSMNQNAPGLPAVGTPKKLLIGTTAQAGQPINPARSPLAKWLVSDACDVVPRMDGKLCSALGGCFVAGSVFALVKRHKKLGSGVEISLCADQVG